MPCSFDIRGCQEGAQVALYLPLGHQKEIEFGEKWLHLKIALSDS